MTLSTESNNEKTRGLSSETTLGMLKLINDEDKTVAYAVERALPQIAAAVDLAVERIKKGGRAFYIGCGTSGRLAVIDASEIGCTYGEDGVFKAVVAGGKKGFGDASIGDEDSFKGGARDIKRAGITSADIAVGLSASGGARYVLGALSAAKATGAATVGIANNAGAKITAAAGVGIELLTGAEAVEGSTRMKAGTAQKMTLNMLSTAVMCKLGKVYKNYMINMRPYNDKLKTRAVRITAACAECSESVALSALETTGWDIKAAIDCALKRGGL